MRLKSPFAKSKWGYLPPELCRKLDRYEAMSKKIENTYEKGKDASDLEEKAAYFGKTSRANTPSWRKRARNHHWSYRNPLRSRFLGFTRRASGIRTRWSTFPGG